MAEELGAAQDPKARIKTLIGYSATLEGLPQEDKVMKNRVMGCTAQVWLMASLADDGTVVLRADSDSDITRGLCAVLVTGLAGLKPAELAEVSPDTLLALPLGPAVMVPSRTNGFLNMLETARKLARGLMGEMETFPSLLLKANSISAQGSFAESQAQYLRPNGEAVERVVELLSSKKIGVVAHFYMDPQVQGVLSSAGERWPHIHISDSLVMADTAVRLVEEGCKYIIVLGVDFMSENVRAVLDAAGHTDVPVYRLAEEHIGCSLAEAAESDSYFSYLSEAESTPNSMHVIYINTSLRTKALAHVKVPTITCTSSNVVQTVLQGFAQIPGLNVWYGPDTYMGENLASLFLRLSELPDEEVQKLHPAHTQASIKELLPRLRYFQDGTCIVHHMFGGRVTELVRTGYSDAYLTAHFEVPGEMFQLALEAGARGAGCVGSTSNILDFISARLDEALARPFGERLRFVLGTETGMSTSIVRKVQAMLNAAGREDVEVEVIFPVSPDAITTLPSASPSPSPVLDSLRVIPGPAAGEGCSAEGGCASCPYMKMNSLDALEAVCRLIGTPGGSGALAAYEPEKYEEGVGGMSMAQAGCISIMHMRGFQQGKVLPEALVQDIVGRH